MSRFRASAQITQEWQNFDFSVADGVATVTLNRPEKLNALTFEAYADLRDLLAEMPYRGDSKVLVLRGTGRGFCGGGDVNEIIGELIKMEARDLMSFTKMTGDVIRAMREMPIPVIAGIQGIAAGQARYWPWRPTSGSWRSQASLRSCSRRSACPAAIWVRPICCPGSSGSGVPPSS
jgi:1,4-dihydroxy-2-naphthoyl-CoA synthase